MRRRDKNKYNKRYKNIGMRKILAIVVGLIMLLSLIPYFLLGW